MLLIDGGPVVHQSRLCLQDLPSDILGLICFYLLPINPPIDQVAKLHSPAFTFVPVKWLRYMTPNAPPAFRPVTALYFDQMLDLASLARTCVAFYSYVTKVAFEMTHYYRLIDHNTSFVRESYLGSFVGAPDSRVIREVSERKQAQWRDLLASRASLVSSSFSQDWNFVQKRISYLEVATFEDLERFCETSARFGLDYVTAINELKLLISVDNMKTDYPPWILKRLMVNSLAVQFHPDTWGQLSSRVCFDRVSRLDLLLSSKLFDGRSPVLQTGVYENTSSHLFPSLKHLYIYSDCNPAGILASENFSTLWEFSRLESFSVRYTKSHDVYRTKNSGGMIRLLHRFTRVRSFSSRCKISLDEKFIGDFVTKQALDEIDSILARDTGARGETSRLNCFEWTEESFIQVTDAASLERLTSLIAFLSPAKLSFKFGQQVEVPYNSEINFITMLLKRLVAKTRGAVTVDKVAVEMCWRVIDDSVFYKAYKSQGAKLHSSGKPTLSPPGSALPPQEMSVAPIVGPWSRSGQNFTRYRQVENYLVGYSPSVSLTVDRDGEPEQDHFWSIDTCLNDFEQYCFPAKKRSSLWD